MKYLPFLLLFLAPDLLADRVIHREKSLYRNIVVTERADRRCLAFSVKRRHRNQTCIDVGDPDRIVFPYVRMTFAGLLANPNPRRALMIGLGGGTISNVLLEQFPDLTIDLVEVDPAVLRVAKAYFDFEEVERSAVHIIDGRVFTRRAARKGEKYDFIILDAYTGEYIPEHLLTQEFLTDIRALLTDDGVVVANTFAVSKLYDHESRTYESVFGDFFNFKLTGTGNRVIVAQNNGLPDDDKITAAAGKLAPAFEKYGVDMQRYARQLSRKKDWSPDARPLTDQFAPANLLRSKD